MVNSPGQFGKPSRNWWWWWQGDANVENERVVRFLSPGLHPNSPGGSNLGAKKMNIKKFGECYGLNHIPSKDTLKP